LIVPVECQILGSARGRRAHKKNNKKAYKKGSNLRLEFLLAVGLKCLRDWQIETPRQSHDGKTSSRDDQYLDA
jgi:hypothetical protein